MMCMNVDLPEPDGPVTATNSPASMERLTPPERAHLHVAHGVGLRDVLDCDDRHRGSSAPLAPEGGLRNQRRSPSASWKQRPASW